MRIIFNAKTGERVIEESVEHTEISLEEQMRVASETLSARYREALLNGFYSSATGYEVHYGYKEVDQLNYSKLANLFALNLEKASTYLGTVSHGVISLTREQYIILMDDAEQFEMGLYLRRKQYESAINNSITVEELNSIVIDFS